ncbi:MAG: hypothetical protein AAGA86_04370 [Bacteroidota bacterium]
MISTSLLKDYGAKEVAKPTRPRAETVIRTLKQPEGDKELRLVNRKTVV